MPRPRIETPTPTPAAPSMASRLAASLGRVPAAVLATLLATALALTAAGNAQAQAAPSLAEQMRALLGRPALPNTSATATATTATTTAATSTAPAAASALPAIPPATRAAGPVLAEGPPQLRQSATALAQRFPAAQRSAMTRAFEESFAFWSKLEAQLGLAPDDLAAGLAAFIAGNYAVFMQQEVPDEQFKTLVRQMQGLLGQSPGIQQAGAAHRRSMYEQLAMVGTFMVVYREQLKTRPNPAEEVNFRHTAKANLETALGVGVERMRLGAQGLELR